MELKGHVFIAYRSQGVSCEIISTEAMEVFTNKAKLPFPQLPANHSASYIVFMKTGCPIFQGGHCYINMEASTLVSYNGGHCQYFHTLFSLITRLFPQRGSSL